MRLVDWLAEQEMSNSEFARRLGGKLGSVVASQNVWRWTRETDHEDYGVPSPEAVVAIYFLTKKAVTIESWYAHMLKPKKARAA